MSCDNKSTSLGACDQHKENDTKCPAKEEINLLFAIQKKPQYVGTTPTTIIFDTTVFKSHFHVNNDDETVLPPSKNPAFTK